MACEHYYELISAQLDRELTREEEQELNAHLEQCPSCRALAEQLAGLHEDFSALEEVPAPEGFVQGVMERIREEKKVIPLFKRPQFKAAAGLAACLAICVGLYGAGQLPFTNEAENSPLQGAAAPSVSSDHSEENGSDSKSVTQFYLAPKDETEGTTADAVPDPNTAQQDTQPASEDILPRVNTAKYGASTPQFASGGTSQETQSVPEEPEDQPPAAEPETPVEEPTVEGADNQNGLSDGENHSSETCLFKNEQVIQVTCDAAPEAPSAVILGSTQSLEEFVGVFAKDDLSVAVKSYDEAFFQNGRLLAAVAAADSGSGPFQLMENGLTKEQVTLTEQDSGADTGAQSVWLILAEVGTEFSNGDTLNVVIDQQ